MKFVPPGFAAFIAARWHLVRIRSAALLLLGLHLFAPGSAVGAQPKLTLNAATGLGALVQTPEVRAELVAYAPEGIGRSHPLRLGLLLQHQPGWHTYWENPGDSGLPTELRWTLPTGLNAGPLRWPTPTKINIGRLSNFGFEGTVLLPVDVAVEPQFRPAAGATEITIGLSASWLVCKKECIPQEGEFVLRLPLRGSTALQGPLFEAARARQPETLQAQVRAEFDGDNLLLRADSLPPAWQGKAVNVFPQVANVFAGAGSPCETDRAEAGVTNPNVGSQRWEGAVWSALLPLSAQRTTTPTQIGLLFALGERSFQGVAEIKGRWPEVPAPKMMDLDLPSGADNATQMPRPSPAASQSGGAMAWALAAAFVGGLILNLMPCVFPVLAIKVLGFASAPAAGQQRVAPGMVGLAYTAGVVASMAALGGGLLALRAGGEQLGWGFQLQSPAVVTALALLFTLIAMNLVGLLDWGTLVPQGLAGLHLRHPAADAALSGVLAVAVASPCTAPFMGASLGLALTLPAWQAMGIFVALGLGLALPFALISSLPPLARWLPRPGAWMEHLRQFMAFPMAATVLWLLWVLGHMGGLDAAVSLAALLLCMVLTLWSLSLRGRSRWMFGCLALLVSLGLLRTLGPNVLQTQASVAAPAGAAPIQAGMPTADWQPWSPQRVSESLAGGRPVFVDFTAAWCITCQYNKQTTLSDTAVMQDFAAKQVTLLRADWTQRDPLITQTLADLGRSGVPVYVLYQPAKPPVVLSEILSSAEVRAALRVL